MEVPARVDIAGERSARPAGLLGVREVRPVVAVAAFLVAVLIGVAIGYATADRGSGDGTTVNSSGQPAPELTPALRTAPWEGTRQPGRAHQMRVDDEPNPTALRLALSWTVAEQIRAAGNSTITAAQVTVPQGMFFGAVEGVDAAHDAYWAIGRIEVAGVASRPPDPYVWRRIGTGPWTIVRNGPNACTAIPPVLIQEWKGQPAPCAG
ncbi:hypothetical protein FF36_04146 [Frankia torreyi]|uniref:Uncharacterized protein n=1 Tax=Frankia torreyi TaxID=1856 RepID=A0A0D8BDT9_9ACTN|nr:MULTISPECIES: hypothetical protein [Frankia]KJE21572.1 hypothetical protein FF36_04146 [Frankia torreyi]KQM06706.1 hypothetical protein FF86_1007115 [Frankia sp. CpI1-P]